MTRPIALIAALAALALAGCGLRSRGADRPPTVVPRDVLERCAGRYAAARTLVCRGELAKPNTATRIGRPLAIYIQRPASCRIEFGDDVTVVLGREVWHRLARDGRVGRYRAFDEHPLQTAAEMTTGGVRCLPIDLFERGATALDLQRGGRWSWRLEGHDYAGRRPCFVLARESAAREGELRLWIDQDDYALRRWSVSSHAALVERPVVSVEFDEVTFDERLGARTFRVTSSTDLLGAAP